MTEGRAGVELRSSTVAGSDGVRLRFLRWIPERPAPRLAPLVVVHGSGEHGGRYGELAERLAGEGRHVVAYDQRGHGESQGRRGVLEDFDLLPDDLGAVLRAVGRVLPGTPRPFVLGHSLGGLVVLRFLQRGSGPGVAGAVVSAPWLGTKVELPLWKRMVRPLLERVAPDLTLPTGLPTEDLTSDPEKQREYEADPLVHHRVSTGSFREIRRAQSRALEEPLPPRLPLLFLVPGGDRVVDGELTLRFARALEEEAGDREVEVVELPGMRHEPFQERDRSGVHERVAAWLHDRESSETTG